MLITANDIKLYMRRCTGNFDKLARKVQAIPLCLAKVLTLATRVKF